MTYFRARRLPRLLFAAEAIFVVFALAWVLIGVRVYMHPSTPVVHRADVIFVIGPPTANRLAQAKKMRAEHVSDRILISVTAKGYYSKRRLPICRESGVTCEVPDPTTTNGEARMLRLYAAQHKTRTAVVLTFTPHVARSRYIFDKCYGPGVTVVPVRQALSPLIWGYQFAYQSGGFVKAALIPCA